MSRPARQVRTVRLRAPDQQLIRRGALLLEDALHTASLPDTVGGRLLLVRSLACGPIRAGHSPATLALRIEQRLRELSATALPADETTAEQAVAVFFHDPVEPYIRLALRLARHEPTRGWFWPLAVPGWRPELPRDEALRVILSGVTTTEPGAVAAARLVRALHHQAALPDLLAALRWQDGPALLRASGYARPAPGTASVLASVEPGSEPIATPLIGPDWHPVLARWFGWWGVEDARSVWLAHVALVAERPARLLDVQLAQHAQRLIQLLAAPPAPETEQRLSGEPSTAPTAAALRPAEQPTAEPAAPASAQPRSRATSASRPEPQTLHAPAAPLDPESRWTGIPQRSVYAGLFFLLPALARLGIADTLEQHPLLIELGLPDLVLRTLAQRLGSAPADPALLALADPSLLQQVTRLSWVAPLSWLELTAPGSLLVRRIGARGTGRAITDRSGLLLALWHGRAPRAVRPLLARRRLSRGLALPPQPDLTRLTGAWLVALRRWCRRYAGLGLAELARRPGRIAATRSHLDVLLDHRLADLRIRRAGLDLDPGWLPWFGRVVLFHYLYGEQ